MKMGGLFMSLRRSLFIVLFCALMATAYVQAGGLEPRGAAPAAPATALSQSAESQATAESQRAVLQRYCFVCHSDQLRTGGLSLEAVDVADVASAGETWEKVVRKLNAGMMPPPGRPRPDAVTQRGFVSWLEAELDRAALANPDPGHTETFHRLNRTEYKNAIRDLLALDIAVDELLPPDDSSYGFDNNAGVLRLSQSLMERYLLASRKISRWALGLRRPRPSPTRSGCRAISSSTTAGRGSRLARAAASWSPTRSPGMGSTSSGLSFRVPWWRSRAVTGPRFRRRSPARGCDRRRARAPVRAAVEGARERVWRGECPRGCREHDRPALAGPRAGAGRLAECRGGLLATPVL